MTDPCPKDEAMTHKRKPVLLPRRAVLAAIARLYKRTEQEMDAVAPDCDHADCMFNMRDGALRALDELAMAVRRMRG